MPQREDSMSETPRQERVWHAQKKMEEGQSGRSVVNEGEKPVRGKG